MLLVMHTAGILSSDVDQSQLWKMTWERIDMFLPHLRQDVFKPHETEPSRNVIDRDAPAEPAQAPAKTVSNVETVAAPSPAAVTNVSNSESVITSANVVSTAAAIISQTSLTTPSPPPSSRGNLPGFTTAPVSCEMSMIVITIDTLY